MKKNFFNIRVIFDTSPSENGADISTTQERVKEGTGELKPASNDPEAIKLFRGNIETITKQHLEKEVENYENEFEMLVKTALNDRPGSIFQINTILASEGSERTAEQIIAQGDYKSLYVSEKIIRALFGNDAKILQKYTGYTISNLRLAQLNVNIVERDNFLPRLEKVRNTLIDHLNDPTVFETLKKELNLSYKSIDEWKANMTTENILQMVYLKNPELAKKVFPTKSTLRDDIAEYQSVLGALESFKFASNVHDAQMNRDKKMIELLNKIEGMSNKIVVLIEKMDDKDVFKSSLIALQKDIGNPDRDALQIRGKIFQDAINLASRDAATRLGMEDIFQRNLPAWKELAMGDTPGMEGIMQLNENSRYEDFVANSYIRTKFMESNEEVKSAILSSASPRHHDDILEIYNEITDLYGIQTEVKSEERRMQTVTEENEKIWKSYNDNDTFGIEKWRNSSDSQQQNNQKSETLIQEIKGMSGSESGTSVSVSQLMDKLQSDSSLSEKLKSLPNGFELPIGKGIIGKIEHSGGGLSLTIGGDTWNLGEKNPGAEYRRIQRLTMTPHFETLILPMGQDAIQTIYKKINLRPELLPLHNKDDTVISSFRFSYILTKVLDSIANKKDDTMDGLSVDVSLSGAPNDNMESFQSYLSSNSAGLDSLYQKIQSKNDSLPSEKKVLDARGQVNPTMFLSLLDSVNFQVT